MASSFKASSTGETTSRIKEAVCILPSSTIGTSLISVRELMASVYRFELSAIVAESEQARLSCCKANCAFPHASV